MKQIDGVAIAQKVHEESKQRIASLAGRGIRPGLAVVLVGEDPASRAYVRSKDKKAAELGLHSVKHELPADTSQIAAFTASWSNLPHQPTFANRRSLKPSIREKTSTAFIP